VYSASVKIFVSMDIPTEGGNYGSWALAPRPPCSFSLRDQGKESDDHRRSHHLRLFLEDFFSDSVDGRRGKAKRLLSQTEALIPTTIKLLQDAVKNRKNESSSTCDDYYFRCGARIDLVKVVTTIKDIEFQVNRVRLTLDDTTCTMPCHIYFEVDEKLSQTMRKNRYVILHGTLSQWKGEVVLVAHSISPLSDVSELIYHLTEVSQMHQTVRQKI